MNVPPMLARALFKILPIKKEYQNIETEHFGNISPNHVDWDRLERGYSKQILIIQLKSDKQIIIIKVYRVAADVIQSRDFIWAPIMDVMGTKMDTLDHYLRYFSFEISWNSA